MSGGNTIAKIFITVLMVANVGFLAYNGTSFYRREIAEKDEVERQRDRAARIRELALAYQADMDRIIRQNYRPVDKVSDYIQEQARAAGLDPLRDEIHIPLAPDTTAGSRRFLEETWKVRFTSRSKTFSLRRLADFCIRIEEASPGFQIKYFIPANRVDVWGKDEWVPDSIVVRRITPKAKES